MEAGADEVVLRLPARPEYCRIARVGVASLGLRQGMSFAAIDDLRRVVDETFTLLLDGTDSHGSGSDDFELALVFRMQDQALEFHAARSVEGSLSEAAVHRFDAITAGLIDDYDLDTSRAELRILKKADDYE